MATKPITGSSSWLNPSTRVCTSPRSGLLADTRAASTVTRIRSCVAGPERPQPAQLVDAG